MLNLSTIDELVQRGAQGGIQSAVSAVEDWSREQCMQLNADKCKDMIIDFKNNKTRLQPCCGRRDGTSCYNSAKRLGVTLSRRLL